MAGEYSMMPYGITPKPGQMNGANPYQTTYLDPSSGRPQMPGFTSIGDPNTGLLQQPYIAGSQMDSRGLDALRAEALRTGPSAWSSLAKNQAADSIAKNQAGQVTQATNQLAMKGGLRGGAAERIASQGVRGGLNQNQNAWSQIALQDEANRQGALKALPGADLQNANYLSGVQNTNINNARSELSQKRLSDLGIYSEQMRGWAAEQMANAVPQQQQGGGLLGSVGMGSVSPIANTIYNPIGTITNNPALGFAANPMGSVIGSVVGGGGGK